MADVQTTHRDDGRDSAFAGVSNWLRLAAAPTFAVMALVSAVDGGSKDMICSMAQDASPLTGMVAMYVLMSIFHSLPWLKVISGWLKRSTGGGSYA